MDNEWGHEISSVCVPHGSTISIPVNGSAPLDATVDDLKVAIWWYDRRHETGTLVDNIDLEVYVTGLGTASSFSLTDNKERVFRTGVGGRSAVIRIKGTNVTSDLEGCGFNSMLVYYGYFYEDDQRDDLNGSYVEVE